MPMSTVAPQTSVVDELRLVNTMLNRHISRSSIGRAPADLSVLFEAQILVDQVIRRLAEEDTIGRADPGAEVWVG